MCNGNCNQGRECDCEFAVKTTTGEPLTLVKPDYNLTFYRGEKQFVGKLDFNGPAMKFEGNAEETAKMFFRWIAEAFNGRLKEERESAEKMLRNTLRALEWHGAHSSNCDMLILLTSNPPQRRPCNCGLKKSIEEAREFLEKK